MKYLAFFALSVFLCLGVSAQDNPNDGDATVHYGYDAAGNRISKLIVITYSTSESSSSEDDPFMLEGEQEVASLAVDAQEADEHFSVYPNPTLDWVFFENTFDLSQTYTLLLTSLDGKTMSQQVVRSSREQVDVSALPSGTYIISIVERPALKWEIIKN